MIDSDPSSVYSSKSYLTIGICFVIIILLGFGIFFFTFDGIECDLVVEVQNFGEKTLGILFFSVMNYLGDFYIWTLFSAIFSFYTYFRSRTNFRTSIELAIYLILVTTFTFFLKIAFARPRPHCLDLLIYDQQASFAYPSGHVSRGYALVILVQQRNAIVTLLMTSALFLLSLSRIVLGAHFLTDIIGSLFLSSAICLILSSVALPSPLRGTLRILRKFMSSSGLSRTRRYAIISLISFLWKKLCPPDTL